MKMLEEYEKEAEAILKKKAISLAVNTIVLALAFIFMWCELGFLQSLSVYIAIASMVAVHESSKEKF